MTPPGPFRMANTFCRANRVVGPHGGCGTLPRPGDVVRWRRVRMGLHHRACQRAALAGPTPDALGQIARRRETLAVGAFSRPSVAVAGWPSGVILLPLNSPAVG